MKDFMSHGADESFFRWYVVPVKVRLRQNGCTNVLKRMLFIEKLYQKLFKNFEYVLGFTLTWGHQTETSYVQQRNNKNWLNARKQQNLRAKTAKRELKLAMKVLVKMANDLIKGFFLYIK